MIWQERTGRIEQVPWQADWLSAGEQDVIRSTRSHRGRFAARLLAKQLLAEHYRSVDHYNQIHIESRDGRDRSTRPCRVSQAGESRRRSDQAPGGRRCPVWRR